MEKCRTCPNEKHLPVSTKHFTETDTYTGIAITLTYCQNCIGTIKKVVLKRTFPKGQPLTAQEQIVFDDLIKAGVARL